MDVRNCRKCRRLFNYIGNSKYCPACTEQLEKKFHEVKEYIYKNPGVGIRDVSEAMDVEPSQIKQWIREERLILSNASEGEIVCESCGVCIVTGRYCDKCKAAVTSGLTGIYRPVQQESDSNVRKQRDKDRMRFLDSI